MLTSLTVKVYSEYTGLPLHQILHPLMMVLITPRLILWMKAVESILSSLHAATKTSFQEIQVISV